jgi:flagellar basal-body rod protein FlgC
MDIFTSMQIGASALKANKIRLNTISSNMANVETTSTPEGGPYKKKSVYFQTEPVSFKQHLESNLKTAVQGVKVTEILEDKKPPKLVYNPDHPDADDNGYVAMPNINILEEMVDMMSTTRLYDANTTVIKSAKRMALKSLEIGR